MLFKTNGGKNMEKDKEPILIIEDVNKSFPGVKALNHVSLEVGRGIVHGIIGENGAGKSTLMKILSGVYTKDSGTVIFDGNTIEHTTPIQSLNMGLSIIYQELNLVNSMSVGENIFLGRFKELNGMKGVHRQAKELLDSIGCKINTYTLVEKLSVSEKQMVEIAKALSFRSKLIIMDEPSSSLTDEELEGLYQIIEGLKQKGIAIIYISHKMDEIFRLCETVTIMRDGNVIETNRIGAYTREDIIAKMVGRSIEMEFPERPRSQGNVLMEVNHLNSHKLHDISFQIKCGEILGLVGLVGAGRSEIVRAIFGADKVKGHTIKMAGRPVNIRRPADAIKAGIAFVPEDRKEEGLVLPFSVEQNISMAALKNISPNSFVNKSREQEMAREQIKALEIKTPSEKTKVVSLSGGNQQKCILARWLEMKPKVLILDEPTKGIDVGAKYEIYLLMKQIAESGSAIILISSELPEVLNMSNRVLTVSEGKITGEFNPEGISAEVIMKSALA
ncbi:hypothetical protein AR437_12615 [Christensenella hongkongensis]|uniref:Ribose ABC transport system, ATP-binding protein RbsA n=2 Tax=Christensenella hongkongensis TaxID=270498 RepID=A0A0M2NM96_9FIRM|nr:Ribose ABC transport system, ATP-binding protein RbsA [Christensenella hongkongensis]KUJ24943.1 hypothetical protein AR437_12615 [Christensenella hongkongensis]